MFSVHCTSTSYSMSRSLWPDYRVNNPRSYRNLRAGGTSQDRKQIPHLVPSLNIQEYKSTRMHPRTRTAALQDLANIQRTKYQPPPPDARTRTPPGVIQCAINTSHSATTLPYIHPLGKREITISSTQQNKLDPEFKILRNQNPSHQPTCGTYTG